MLLGPAVFFGKCALLLLYLRIFSPGKAFRYQIYATIAFAFGTQVSMIPVDTILCAPPRGISWAIPNPNCSKSYVNGVVAGPSSLLIDLIVFYLPIPVIMRLHMPKRRRLGILAIFLTAFMCVDTGNVNRTSKLTD